MEKQIKTAQQFNYGTPKIGVYLDHANHNADELSAEIVNLAVALGFPLDTEANALLAKTDEEKEQDEDFSQCLHELSEQAIEWLNEQETRSFLYWANEGEAGAFGLFVNVEGAKEECEFTSSKSNEFPPDDYRGEWLHVSDHGNATLYVREDGQGQSGKLVADREIWSVV